MPDASTEKTLSYSRALLELTVHENGVAMATISRAYSEVARLLAELEQDCRRLRGAAPEEDLAALEQRCAAGSLALREALGAVQLHDITDQRLSHVVAMLGALDDGENFDIASVLTESEERALLDLIESGVRVDEALVLLQEQTARPGSVELF